MCEVKRASVQKGIMHEMIIVACQIQNNSLATTESKVVQLST